MAYPAILGRRLDMPVINLGFSGSGRCEPGIVDLLAEIDASAFVVDSVVNMEPGMVEERFRGLLSVLRARRPHTPLVLLEEAVHPSCYARLRTVQTPRSAIVQRVFDDERTGWNGRLFLVRGDQLLGDDGEATVDGIHPTDLGFQRMADALAPFLARVLAGAAGQGAGGARQE